MTDKKLKKLSRQELLELLLEQTREVERLRGELEKAEAVIEERRIKVDSSGSIAEAALKINEVMEAAQAAAAQYLENIEMMEKEAEAKCRRLIEEARAEAERIKTQPEADE